MNALIAALSVALALAMCATSEYVFDFRMQPYWQVLLGHWDVLTWWGGWVTGWALLERIFAGRIDWLWHAAVAGVGLLAISVLWNVLPTLAYSLGYVMPDLLQDEAALMVIGGAVAVHLRRLPSSPRLTSARRLGLVTALSVLACCVLALRQPPNIQAQPELTQAPPATWMLRKPLNTQELLTTLNAMHASVEAGRTAPVPDGLL